MTKRKDSKSAPAIDKLPFEDSIDRLEDLIEKIESGEVGLEETLQHYEQGTALIKHCHTILAAAEKRIAELKISESGDLLSEADDEEDADDTM